jgi:hypothetical protein
VDLAPGELPEIRQVGIRKAMCDKEFALFYHHSDGDSDPGRHVRLFRGDGCILHGCPGSTKGLNWNICRVAGFSIPIRVAT